MQRPVLATGVTVVQLLLGLALAGTCAYLLVLARGPQQSSDAAGARQGLELAAAMVAPLALLVLAAAYGLARRRRWGWWLALLMDFMLVILWVYSMIDDGWRNLDWTVVGFTAASLLPLVLLLVPAVRRFYWARPQVQPPAATHV
jgi:hypothetical protein